jgi:O-acetyl-ADP-ribose deacetylase (regulator of RNase III)
MIEYMEGNLLEADAQALVNTVNTVGVMGKGIALQFKENFKVNYNAYVEACKRGQVQIGKMLVVRDSSLQGERVIINFPTKTEWYKKSQYNFIEEGLKDLVRVLEEYQISSVALPPLGCGHGGLSWEKVKRLIEKYLQNSPAKAIVFQPNEKVKEILQKQQAKKDVKLTDARAMLLYALAKYEERGEVANVFAANKIAYFLQESGEPMRLHFVPYTYGPYDQAVEKVLYALNGKYLTGLEQMTAKPFEPLQLKYENFGEVNEYIQKQLSPAQRTRLASVFELIAGFESSLALEILSSIHFLRAKDRSLSTKDLLEQIQAWNDRKKNLIKEEYVNVALERLQSHGSKLNFA